MSERRRKSRPFEIGVRFAEDFDDSQAVLNGIAEFQSARVEAETGQPLFAYPTGMHRVVAWCEIDPSDPSDNPDGIASCFSGDWALSDFALLDDDKVWEVLLALAEELDRIAGGRRQAWVRFAGEVQYVY